MGKGSDNWTASNKAIMIAMALVLAVSIFYGVGNELGLFNKSAVATDVTIQSIASDKLGIDAEAGFLLTSKKPVSEDTVRAALKLAPSFSYTLAKQAGGLQYKIVPEEKLASNTIYVLSFDQEGVGKENLSWAFQTKEKFRVVRSLPSDQSTQVPVNTGIEMTFSSENFDQNNIQTYFSISPQIEGTFEKHKKTLVFVPKALKPTTIYTVTLKKGFTLPGTSEILENDTVFSFETGTADQAAPAFSFDMDTSLTEFGTAEPPAFSCYYDQYSSDKSTITPPSLHIDLYRYPDNKTFQASLSKRDAIPHWSYFTWNRYHENLDPQKKIAEYNTQFLSTNAYTHYIVFPKGLEAGYYAAEIKAGDTVRQVWFQVSDLSVYLAEGKNSSLFWANDLKIKEPASNVQVTIASKNLSVNGDQTGAVLINQKIMGTDQDYALVKSGSMETLVPLQAQAATLLNTNTNAADYWKYLYLDRELYRPGDTLHFWGVLASRSKDGTQPKEITLELQGTDGPFYEGAEATPILTQKISVKDKTYTGQLTLPILKPGYYYFDVKIGDTVLLSRGFSVETYQKPAYKLTITQDKKAIFTGESLTFKTKATFFEGTPVPDLKLNYQIQDKSSSITTDTKGQANIRYIGLIQEDETIPYSYVSLGVNAVLPEAGEIYSTGELYLFKSKVYLTGEAKRLADGYTLTAKLSAVDLTGVNNGQTMSEENFLKGTVPNSLLKAALYQEVWTKVESGQYYNFINKKVEKTYYYNYSTKLLNNFDLTTDAAGTVNYTGKLDPQNSYYLDLTAQDNEGRQFLKRIYIGGYYGVSPDSQYYFLQGTPGVNGFSSGENVQVSFMANDRELIPTGKSLLFFRGQKQIDAYEVTANPKYSFAFTNEYIPNVDVFGVYFDGYNYHEASSISVPFASSTKALNVKIKTNQAQYRPGDKVKLDLQVMDVNNKPVKGAQVNLNLVDEALFSLSGQSVDLLHSLYDDYVHPFLVTWKSHFHPNFYGAAEKGGEGGSDRKDFRDTVLFTSVQTDTNGKANVEFQLPDNLTSWRVTFHAFTQDLQAGSGTTQIPVRLPFFIEMTLNTAYLTGDSPAVLLRSYGEKLGIAQKVFYTMKLVNPKGEVQTWTKNGVSFTSLDWSLPVLEAGKYSLTVSANCNGLKDSLTKEFVVAASFQQRTITSQALLKEGLEIKGTQLEPTTVVFSDYEKSQYLRGLYQLAWNDGSRLELKLAGLQARKLLNQYFPDEKIAEEETQDSLLIYQQTDGGISILPYGESELALSAMVAASSSGIFDDRALSGYFYGVLEGTAKEDDKSLALLGLAALKEPVLLQINETLQEKKLAPAVKINLALALLKIGNGAYAQTVYRELMNSYSQDLGSEMMINSGKDQDEIIAATTQMALLAACLDQPEKNKLYQYLLENPGKDILNTLEQLQILKYNLQYMKSSPVSFTYELNGKKVTKSLKDRELFKLTLLPADLMNIKFSKVVGNVGIMTQYSLPIQAGETGLGQDLAISRTYLVNNQKTNTLNRSDLVQVVINYTIGDKAPEGLYEIVDVLPAGLVDIPRPNNYLDNPDPKTDWDYPTEVNGQRLVFQVTKGQHKITYLARVISPGEFTCEAPVLSNIKNNLIYTSGIKDRLTIK